VKDGDSARICAAHISACMVNSQPPAGQPSDDNHALVKPNWSAE
jgi:hypothetical protein